MQFFVIPILVRCKIYDANLSRAVFINSKIISSLILGDLSCTDFINTIIKGNSFSSNNMTNSLNVSNYTAAKLTNSKLLDYMEKDPDGQTSSNIFPMGMSYGYPAVRDQFVCQRQEIKK